MLLSIVMIARSQPDRNSAYELVLLKNGQSQQWAYEIYRGKKLIIRQERVPAASGLHYFTKKGDAEKAGRLVIKKLKERKTPSLTAKELENLNILPK